MKTDKIDWDAINSQVIAALDIVAEYTALGVEFAADKPNSKGWIACKAFGRSDKNPSAGVNTKTGRYHDFGGGGESQGLWDFAAATGKFADWRAARIHYAKVAGVDLPEDRESRQDDAFEFRPLTPGCALLWARRKPPIEPEAIRLAGGVASTWPKGGGEYSQQLISFPMFGSLGLSADPVAWHSVRIDGQQVRINDKITTAKMTKGPPGLLNRHGLQNLASASVVWLVEGLTSMLALQSVIGDRVDHVVISPGACTYSPRDGYGPLFKGKDVRLVFDLDEPTDKAPEGAGQVGARVWGLFLAKFAKAVRNIILPGERPQDLRDWLEAGNTYAGLCDLAERSAAKFDAIEGTVGSLSNASRIVQEGSTKLICKDSYEIYRDMKDVAGNWPRRVLDGLFVDDGGSLIWLPKQAKLFGWLSSKCRLEWHSTPEAVPKAEFYEFLKNKVPQYNSVEVFPHFPPNPRNYYLDHGTIKDGDGSTLRRFIDRFFRPDTPEDWDLLYATILTLFWGGPAGTRPAVLFTSRQGRGVGKTATAQAISKLAGGTINADKGERVEDLKKRLLTQDAQSKRVVLIDNIKAERFSWAAFEALVTADTISGHQMYAGERSIQNQFMWFLTINGPQLSRDIAQRVIPIYLRRPEQYARNWQEEYAAYISNNHWQIVADVQAAFARQPAEGFEPKTRWGSWEYEVIGRLPDPWNVQRTIAERQVELDEDIETGSSVEEYIEGKLSDLGYRTSVERVFIPTDLLSLWYRDAIGEPIPPRVVGRRLKQAFGEGTITRLIHCPVKVTYDGGSLSTTHRGRGFIWNPTTGSGGPDPIEEGNVEDMLAQGLICRDLVKRSSFRGSAQEMMGDF